MLYIVLLRHFANGEVIESCGVVVIELLKMLRRNGVSSSILVVASWSWIFFLNLCRYSGRENPGLKRCLNADTCLYQICHV